MRHYGREGGYSEIRLLPVKFNKAYNDYQLCTTKLLPMNYDQVKQTEVGFPGGGIELDAAAKKKLSVILAYMKADPTVNHIELNGHSDNSGNRLTNRDVSTARALAVMDYFTTQRHFGNRRSPCVSTVKAIHWRLTPMPPIGRATAGSIFSWSGWQPLRNRRPRPPHRTTRPPPRKVRPSVARST